MINCLVISQFGIPKESKFPSVFVSVGKQTLEQESAYFWIFFGAFPTVWGLGQPGQMEGWVCSNLEGWGNVFFWQTVDVILFTVKSLITLLHAQCLSLPVEHNFLWGFGPVHFRDRNMRDLWKLIQLFSYFFCHEGKKCSFFSGSNSHPPPAEIVYPRWYTGYHMIIFPWYCLYSWLYFRRDPLNTEKLTKDFLSGKLFTFSLTFPMLVN